MEETLKKTRKRSDLRVYDKANKLVLAGPRCQPNELFIEGSGGLVGATAGEGFEDSVITFFNKVDEKPEAKRKVENFSSKGIKRPETARAGGNFIDGMALFSFGFYF